MKNCFSEGRITELAEKFASAISENLFEADIIELARELDMTQEELEYFGWDEFYDEEDDDYEARWCDTYGRCQGPACPEYTNCNW